MNRSRGTGPVTIAIAALLIAACGGGDDADSTDQPSASRGDATASQDAEDVGEPADGAADDRDEPAAQPAGSGDFAVPVARFAAHGPEAANTIAPSCGVGNEQRGGDLLRFTPPDGFEWTSSSGGSSRDEIGVQGPDDVRFTFIEAVTPSELSLVDDFAVVGPSGAEVTIDETTIPVMEVTAEGTTGYALVDLPYLEPLPLLQEGGAWATAIIISNTDGRPTLDEATALLQTVRAERCAVITQAMIYAAAGGFAPVPRFEPDPLGKTWPDEPQPAIAGMPSVGAYSIEQLAYLLPVEASRSQCAAEAVQTNWADDPLGLFRSLSPSGTQHDEFDALVAGC